MELSNLINKSLFTQHLPQPNQVPKMMIPSRLYDQVQSPQPSRELLQQQQQQQQQQQHHQQQQLQLLQRLQPLLIKLPSIHEIIDLSELNYQIANSSKQGAPVQYYTPLLLQQQNYQYKQPQPQSFTSSPFLNSTTNNITSSNNNSNSNTASVSRSSPVNSMVHSPIESPIFQRSSSTSSVSSTELQQQPPQPFDKKYVTTHKIGIISRSQNGRKGRSNLPKKTTMILLDWLYKNINHPYPNPKQKAELIYQTGLSSQQLSNWFINARRRKIRSLKFQEDEKYIL